MTGRACDRAAFSSPGATQRTALTLKKTIQKAMDWAGRSAIRSRVRAVLPDGTRSGCDHRTARELALAGRKQENEHET